MLDIRFITTLGMAIFHSACGLVEYCIPRVVINLDIQHSSVQYLLNIFHKKLHALPCLYAEDYANQEYRAFFENLTEPCWDTFQRCQYHFSKRRKVTTRFTKRAVSSHTSSHRNTYISSYTVCSSSALNTIQLLQQKQHTIQP